MNFNRLLPTSSQILKPGDIYQETNLEGEIWIRDFGQQTDLPVTVARPAGIYGPGEKRLLKIYQMAMQD